MSHCEDCNRKIEELSTDELNFIENKMKSDEFATGGMLTSNESLCNVIDNDKKYLTSISITYKEICEKILDLLDKLHNLDNIKHYSGLVSMLSSMFGQAINDPNLTKLENFEGNFTNIIRKNQWSLQRIIEGVVDNKFLITKISWGGAQECPFKLIHDKKYHGYNYGAEDIIIKNLSNGKEIYFSSLLPHMMLNHEFCEGSVRYRLDPKDVVDTLELQ
jgi:hypothetical protein